MKFLKHHAQAIERRAERPGEADKIARGMWVLSDRNAIQRKTLVEVTRRGIDM